MLFGGKFGGIERVSKDATKHVIAVEPKGVGMEWRLYYLSMHILYHIEVHEDLD